MRTPQQLDEEILQHDLTIATLRRHLRNAEFQRDEARVAALIGVRQSAAFAICKNEREREALALPEKQRVEREWFHAISDLTLQVDRAYAEKKSAERKFAMLVESSRKEFSSWLK